MLSYRLHKVKHLPLLNLLNLKNVLQRNFIEMLPDMINLVVCLKQKKEMDTTINVGGWETDDRRGLKEIALLHVGGTLFSLLKGLDVSPAPHNISLSLCRTSSWLPVTKKSKEDIF